ncbi:hypothetical protein C8A01DRAFT_39876 [Parachaetomium inaequale]|uniref:Uncharacterized protein n=1 Tax=Parachaetomium inaequale TaxID=2588326 RepID=A0AAN6SND7_9PEZI|nr:hypothetical protein C8A01DRAFT_39876 [Parachaetomium inaequale]
MATQATNTPSLAAYEEMRLNYIEAILKVSLDAETQLDTSVTLTPEELQESARPAARGTNVVDISQRNHPQTMGMRAQSVWKMTRFFNALFGVMIEALSLRVPQHHTPLDIFACACAMKPEVLHKAVDGLINRGREHLKQMGVAETTGVSYQEPQRRLEAGLSDAQKAAKRREMVVFHHRIYRWIELEDERLREIREQEDEARRRMERMWADHRESDDELSDWSFEMIGQ